MNTPLILPTKPNVEAAFERYAALLREIQLDPALRDDPEHSAEVEKAEQNWADLFRRWAKTETLPRKRATR